MSGARLVVVGAGAREHALCWRLRLDPGIDEVHVAPGNPGMADVATVHRDVGATDVDAIARLADEVGPRLVVIGPEAPLAAGVVDRLSGTGFVCFGPTRAAARLETSKTFCRQIAESIGIPMADGASFTDADDALRFARRLGAPVAVKADGLAAGKGVTLCRTIEESEAAVRALGPNLVVERLLGGPEASLMAVCDGERAVALPIARDYKRVGDGDSGPNTGGMGAYSPLTDLDDASADRLLDVFHRPALAEMARRGTPFRGLLYAGLLLSADGPVLLEFNARFGDPEAEVVLPRVEGNLAALLSDAARGTLSADQVSVSPMSAVAVVMAAHGYPASPRTGDVIEGIDTARESGALVFHGATDRRGGQAISAGGRVLTLVGRGAGVESAREVAYAAARRIQFAGAHYRSDIGAPTFAALTA